MGWLFSDREEAPVLGSFFASNQSESARSYTRFGVVDDSFLHDSEPEVIASYKKTIAEMESLGLRATKLDIAWWADSTDIFAPIQAWEAARLHAGHYDHFETAIRERLHCRARITPTEIAALHQRHAEFRGRMDDLVATH